MGVLRFCTGVLTGIAMTWPALAATATEAGTTAPSAPVLIPIEDFARSAQMTNPRLSPDGNRIVAEVRLDGESLIGIYDLYGRKFLASTKAETREFTVQWYRWAGNDAVLLGVLQVERIAGREWLGTRLIAFSADGSSPPRLLGRKRMGVIGDDVLYVAEDGSWILLALQESWTSTPSVYRVNVATGEMERVVSPINFVWDWYADDQGVVRMGLGFLNRKIIVYYRERDGDDFEVLGRVKVADDDTDFEPVRFGGEGQPSYILSNKQTGRYALYEFNWKTQEIGKEVFSHPKVDVENAFFEPDGSIRAVTFIDDRERVVWFDEERKEVQEQLEAATPGRSTWIADWSKDRKKALVWTGSSADPGSYYYYDLDVGRMFRLFSANDAITQARLSPSRYVSYKARDGLEIPAYVTYPAGRTENLPLVVMPHGGPFLRDEGRYDPLVQMLANRGYVVLQPNFRGSTGYGREFAEKGWGQWGRAMQDDVTDGVAWLVSEGIADPKRVCIVGGSYGGYVALVAAYKTPDLFRCAASFAGVSDLARMLKYDRRIMAPKRYRSWRDRMTGDEEKAIEENSPLRHVDKISMPILLVHGTEDRRVPVSQSDWMAQALRDAGKPVEVLRMDGAGHSFEQDEQLATLLRAVEAFVMKHNPADGLPGGVASN